MSDLEIERVFLLDRMPELPAELGAACECWQIQQGYFDSSGSKTIGSRHPEGRVRRVELPGGEAFFTHTIKSGLGLVREERETELTEEKFLDLWPATEGRRINKTRTRVRVGEQIWEIDQFLDFELVLAEAELPSTDASLEIPGWLHPCIVREVTEESAFRNFELARSSGEIPGLGSATPPAGA